MRGGGDVVESKMGGWNTGLLYFLTRQSKDRNYGSEHRCLREERGDLACSLMLPPPLSLLRSPASRPPRS